MARIQTLNDRQRECLNTCLATCQNLAYPLLGMLEETGELIEKILPVMQFNAKSDREHIVMLLKGIQHNCHCLGIVAKAIRHQSIEVPFSLQNEIPEEIINTILKEMGDVEWNWNVLAKQLNAEAQSIADINHLKLSHRAAENTIDGKGDEERTPIEEP